MAVKPQQILDYSYVDVVPSHPEYDEVMPESYQFDSFEGYQEYEEDRAYLNIWHRITILIFDGDVTKFNITIINVTSITMFNILW